ncbi:hypothetical protein CRI77_08270 [Mycolicibacterium duvalii]|uniref:Uncharacterized protein n=1 Tax=Mycolicibacterium duvalii TaxID=39688 RepID=A0A7I7K384_9MYCO|nr:DUF732 domain-containing protein [Mycolicibacterium duvalii]MCV7367883.1 DUF732 domain-containing protein [Mycolicibacterium duvalii]PEG42563.1 hypothetical protein CRI77_08270 [Mycolicibacterium duvalii]BBX18527.1 hypothetical protein MDUV_33870 [Mycolicibacterium duvalii]
MIRYRRAVAAAMVAAGLTAFGAAAPAAAQPDDQRFADAVKALGIDTSRIPDVPAVGKQVCDLLTSGLAGNPNPVPVVRGVRSTVQNSGLDRDKATGLMRVSVAAYCPQYARLVGR